MANARLTKAHLTKLAVRQLDRSIEPWRNPELGRRPRGGWIKAIRTTLGMTTPVLAKRLGITAAGMRKLEASEAAGSISLRVLQRVAAALDCEVRYALVPKRPIEVSIGKRATELAKQRLAATNATMALEGQAIDQGASKEQEELLVEQLLQGSARDLWR